jgi:hypothetical protein
MGAPLPHIRLERNRTVVGSKERGQKCLRGAVLARIVRLPARQREATDAEREERKSPRPETLGRARIAAVSIRCPAIESGNAKGIISPEKVRRKGQAVKAVHTPSLLSRTVCA